MENGRIFCSEIWGSICSGTEGSIYFGTRGSTTIGTKGSISSAFPVTYNLSSFITSLERKLSLVVDINDAKLSFKDNLRDLEAKTQFNTVQVVSLFVVLVTFILGGVKITYDTLLSFPKSQFTQFPKVNNFGDSMLLISKTEIQRMVNEAANNNDKIIKSFTHEVMPTFLLFFAIGLLLFVAMGRFLFVNLGGKSMLVPIFISGLLLAIAIFIYLLD